MSLTLSGSPPLTPDQMAALREDSIAMQAVLSGAFDSHIAELKQIQADITVKQQALIALDQANAVKGEADRYASAIKAQADALFDQANKAIGDAANRAAQIESQQKAIDLKMIDLRTIETGNAQANQDALDTIQRERDQFASTTKETNDSMTARAMLLDEREMALHDAQAQLAKDQTDVAALKVQLQSKLDAFAKL